MTRPIVTSSVALLRTMPTTLRRVAPRAMRTPMLTRPLGHDVRHHAVDADRGDDESEHAKQAEQQHVQFPLRDAPGEHLLHRPDVTQGNIGQKVVDSGFDGR